jgi:hypothetical protein
MYCVNCGTELINGVCLKCQQDERLDFPSKETIVYLDDKTKREPTSAKIFSIISVVAGALGLLGYSYPYLSIAAIVFAFLYKSKMKKSNSLTKAGNILGIVGVVLNTIIIAVTAVVSAILTAIGAIYSFVLALAYCFGFVEEFYNFIMTQISYLA